MELILKLTKAVFSIFTLYALQGLAQPAGIVDKVPSSKLPACTGSNPQNWNNCIGTLTYGNGNIYTGEYRNGVREGVGKIRIVAKGTSNANTIASNIPATYEGEWRGNRINGHGIWTTDDGKKYEGDFVDNILIRQGPKIYNTQSPLPEATTQLKQEVKIEGVIGSTYDKSSGANFVLYDGACRYSQYASNYPYHFDAKSKNSGNLIGDGCYSINQQTQKIFLIASNGNTTTEPMSEFQGGSSGSSFLSAVGALVKGVSDGLNAGAKSLNQAQQVNIPPASFKPPSQPIQLQGQPTFNTTTTRNCTTINNGGVLNTTCN